jgi:hypothetical protein
MATIAAASSLIGSGIATFLCRVTGSQFLVRHPEDSSPSVRTFPGRDRPLIRPRLTPA